MDLKNKKFLVIGGAGFIGSHVVDLLLKEGVREVVIYDNFFRGCMDNIEEALKDPRCKLFPHGGDIMYPDILSKAMEGMDGVFHLAALWILQCHEYPRTAFEVNVQGTFNVIESAIKNKIKRVVYSSSASVYGDALQVPMTEDHPYNNFTFYGASKIAGEHFFKSLSHRYGFEWVGLRYMNVYGERQDYKGAYTAVIHKFLDNINIGKDLELSGDGSQEYDFVHVKDVARSNILAMKSIVSGQCFNVGTGVGTTLNHLADLVIKKTNAKSKLRYTNSSVSFVTKRIGSTENAERELGFTADISLSNGLDSLISWRLADEKFGAKCAV